MKSKACRSSQIQLESRSICKPEATNSTQITKIQNLEMGSACNLEEKYKSSSFSSILQFQMQTKIKENLPLSVQN
jgi:hypothetical protein